MENFWFGKRVLITGGDGFVASHLILKLIKSGAVVVSTIRHKRPATTLDLIRQLDEKNDSNPDLEDCDLLNLHELRRVCDRHQIDTVFHLAASAIVVDAANSPFSTIENNVMSTLNILEVARINKIPRVLVVSSDKSYGDHAGDLHESLPYREWYALRGLDVYSASKVSCDLLAQTYSYQFKVPVIVARACNIFGFGDLNFTRLIPKTIMCLLTGENPIINKGNDNVLREYIYVSDVVDAYMFLMENVKEYYGQDNCNMPGSGKNTYGWAAFNVGSYLAEETVDLSKCTKIKSVSEIINLFRSKIRDIEPIVQEKSSNFIEIPDQFLDSSKIRNLGFNPSVNFEEGINKSIEWYSKNYEYLSKLASKYISHSVKR
jgi:CDP-glucose 4,6-dehydratase